MKCVLCDGTGRGLLGLCLVPQMSTHVPSLFADVLVSFHCSKVISMDEIICRSSEST